jgi:hypothetical protein
MNLLYKAKLKFFKMFPSTEMLNLLHLDYIHFGHGIDKTNHRLPHSHLWDTLEVETVPMCDYHKVAYIRTMSQKHFESFIEYGAGCIFHTHGLKGGTVDDELDNLIHNEREYLLTHSRRMILPSLVMLATGSLSLLYLFVK